MPDSSAPMPPDSVPAYTALVLAADRGPGDPVASAAQVCCKPFAQVAGTPMLLRVIDSLEKARCIDAIHLSGPPRRCLRDLPALQEAIDSQRVVWQPNEASPSLSAATALGRVPSGRPVLLTTADHALLDSAMVEFFCAQAETQAQAQGVDLVVAVADRDSVASAYPDARRTLIRLRDGRYGGCNLFALRTDAARGAASFWRRVEQHRKQPLRMMRILGWGTVLRFLLGRLSLQQALERLSARLGLRLGVVRMPFPEAALDVDTESDWHLVDRIARARMS